MTDAREHLVWLDMEMTGLDPETCVPLEVAIVVTNANLDELDSMNEVIWQPEAKLAEMEPYVRNMHTMNGIIEKVRKSENSLADVEKKMLQLLARWFKPIEGVLAGNSIHQDRRFLNKYFPVVDGYLHYRMVDVSTLKELARRWYGSDALFDKATSDHTALSDVRASIKELAHYRKVIMKSSKE